MSIDESFACPCCRLATLDAQGANDICPECGWEDDGQGDGEADEVRGGPNGGLSLTAARTAYQEALRASPDRQDSITLGGAGMWWSMAQRAGVAAGILMPEFDFDLED
jgi:hypothetical protein